MQLRKVAAAALGALMAGMSLAGAALAADYTLSDFPAPFVENGTPNFLIVVGSGGSAAGIASDIAGSLNIAARLGGETVTTEGGETGTTVAGDSFRIDKSTDFLEYDEQLDGVVETLTGSELLGLGGGTFKNAKGSFEYSEYITIPQSAYVNFALDPDDDTDTPANYLIFDASNYAYIYKVQFPTALEATIANIDSHLENKKITLLNKEYTITDVTRNAQNNYEITLMGGASKTSLNHGESADITLDGTTYTITPQIYSGTEVVFTVTYDGTTETTDSLNEGETFTLENGVELGVSDILFSTKETVQSSVLFFLGADKYVLEDNDISDTSFDEKLVKGTNSLANTAVKITGTDDGTTLKISTIQIKWTPDDALYVPEGGKLSEKQDSGEEGQVFGDFDIEFTGVKQSDTEEVKLKPKGDDEYELQFTNEGGETYDLPYLDCDSSTLGFGDETHTLYLVEPPSNSTWNITKNDYFVLTSGLNSYVLQYTGSNADEDTIEFKNLASGNTITISYTSGTVGTTRDSTADATLILGSDEFNVWIYADSNDAQIAVDMNDDGDAADDGDEVMIYTGNGARIDFDTSTLTNGFVLETEELDDGTYKEIIKVPFTCSSDTIEIGTIDGAIDADGDRVIDGGETDTVTMLQIGDTDNYKEISRYGVVLEETKYTDGPDKLTMTYPDDQTEILVYATTGETTTTSSTGEVTRTGVIKTPISAVDTQVTETQKANENLILVGGPCVNKLTADALGLTYPACGMATVESLGIPSDGYMIKLVKDAFAEGKYALVIFGVEAKDTTAACAKVQADMADMTGTEYIYPAPLETTPEESEPEEE